MALLLFLFIFPFFLYLSFYVILVACFFSSFYIFHSVVLLVCIFVFFYIYFVIFSVFSCFGVLSCFCLFQCLLCFYIFLYFFSFFMFLYLIMSLFVTVLSCFPKMSKRQVESFKSVSFDDCPDSPTFPRWRAYSANSMNMGESFDLEDSQLEVNKIGKTQYAKKRTRVRHNSFTFIVY